MFKGTVWVEFEDESIVPRVIAETNGHVLSGSKLKAAQMEAQPRLVRHLLEGHRERA